jgi:peptide chain release factor 3
MKQDTAARDAGAIDGAVSGGRSQSRGHRGPGDHTSRRTFAIISHPDAGKTTLTEKLLHAGGAIRLAGHVRARGERRRARSDWMEIERKRGISVTSSVMTFEHGGITFNLLDTPGHSDFSEDTYRTLTAVDSAIMVIDAARGIESQTRKLFEVCRLRDIPIITFVNKVDREGRDPLEILDQIAGTLALDVAPIVWPIGLGTDFAGCLDIEHWKLTLPDGTTRAFALTDDGGPAGDAAVGRAHADAFESLGIARSALPGFNLASYRAGHLTPVLFGSALKGIGVGNLLDRIARWSPSPRPQPASPDPVAPDDGAVTGFVFKVQANMDPGHRDRIAFVRLCSGAFRRGMKLRNVATGREITVSSPMFFFAQERDIAEQAIAGDVIGIPNHGTLSVGDTLTSGADVRVTGIPDFAPEIIRRVRIADAIKAKQLGKALGDLAEEGVTQVLRPVVGNDWLVGVVGMLQLDVLAARVSAEYGVTIGFETVGHETARWLASDDGQALKRFIEANQPVLARDRAGAPVFLARNAWALDRIQKDWPRIRFLATRERG